MSKFLILGLAIFFIIKDQIHQAREKRYLKQQRDEALARSNNRIYYQGDRKNTKFIE